MKKSDREALRERLNHRFGHFTKPMDWKWWELGVWTTVISEIDRAVRRERRRVKDIVERGLKLRKLVEENLQGVEQLGTHRDRAK